MLVFFTAAAGAAFVSTDLRHRFCAFQLSVGELEKFKISFKIEARTSIVPQAYT
jgi:hypothetical protein